MGTDVGMAVAGEWTTAPQPDVALQLNNLLQVYALWADHGRTEELTALFTPDSEWDGTELGYGIAAGPSSIAEQVTGHFRDSEPMMHMTGPALLTAVSPTEVRGVAWCLATRFSDGQTRPLIYFYYEDTFRKDDGSPWRFSRRLLRQRIGASPS